MGSTARYLRRLLMRVAVMDVWIVRMSVRQNGMLVRMLMRLRAVPLEVVFMQVVFVMRMAVQVL